MATERPPGLIESVMQQGLLSPKPLQPVDADALVEALAAMMRAQVATAQAVADAFNEAGKHEELRPAARRALNRLRAFDSEIQKATEALARLEARIR